MFTKERIKTVVMIVVALAAFAWLADWSPEEKEVMVGLWHDGYMKPANDFTLETMDGGTLTLSDLRGQVVVLNIWATWCAPCLEETPALVRVQEALRGEGVQIVGLSIDSGGWDGIRAFASRFDVNYPIVQDDGVTADSYEGNTGVPTTYLITRDGLIWRYMPGPLTANALMQALQEMPRERPA